MSDRFEDELGYSLQRHAEQVAPSRRDLTADAIDRARRIRARRRTTTVVAGLALIAATVPVTLDLAGGPNDRTELDYAQPSPSEPTNSAELELRSEQPPSRTPEPSESEQATPEVAPTTPDTEDAEPSPDPTAAELPSETTTVEIDFAALPQGPAPELPYFDREAGVIVDGGTEVPVDLTDVAEVVRVSGGYAVQTIGELTEVFLVDPGGSARPLSPDGAAIQWYSASVDGERIAWVEGDSEDSERLLVVADGNGEVIDELPGGAMEIAGFLRDQVAVGSDRDEGASIWAPTSDGPTNLDGTVDAVATDGIGYLAVITGEDDEFRRCTSVLDTGNGNRELWGGCERTVRAMSPGGHYALTVDSRSDGYGDREFRLVDGPSGQPFVTVEPAEPSYFDYSFESSGAVLIEAEDNAQRAIIRCLPDGECEFATPPIPFDADPVSGTPAPYVLGR